MRTHSPLVLDVRELLETPGQPRSLAFDSAVPELVTGVVQVPGEVHFDLTLEAIDGGILVRGEMSGSYETECSRCLKPVTQPFAFTGAELYRPPGDVWEEGYVIKDGTTIDLEPLARDTVGLNLPSRPLCRSDCKGLCSRCGADYNEGTCECSQEAEIDIRWAALRDLTTGDAPEVQRPATQRGAQADPGSTG
jgi:uncharacterized protein